MPAVIELDSIAFCGSIIAGDSIFVTERIFDGTLIPPTVVADSPPPQALPLVSLTMDVISPSGIVKATGVPFTASPTLGIYTTVYQSNAGDELGVWSCVLHARSGTSTKTSPKMNLFQIVATN